MYYKNGDKYCGNWKDNVMSGDGMYCYSDGSVFKGEWKEGVKQGKGKYF